MNPLPEPQWQIRNNGQEYGPYARARILEMLARGELPDAAAIRQEGMPDWLPVPAARQLFQSYQAAGGTLAQAQAPVQLAEPAAPAPPLDMVQAPEAGDEERAGDDATEAPDDAVDLSPPPAAAESAMPAEGAPQEAGARRARRSKAPFVYAAVALLVLAGVWWVSHGGDSVGPDGYAKVKEELVRRMDDWRDHGYWLESVPASAVDGPLVRYSIDPPGQPIGETDTSYTYVVHCTFRDKQGAETESKVTVTMGSKRLRLWNLFSK